MLREIGGVVMLQIHAIKSHRAVSRVVSAVFSLLFGPVLDADTGARVVAEGDEDGAPIILGITVSRAGYIVVYVDRIEREVGID